MFALELREIVVEARLDTVLQSLKKHTRKDLVDILLL